MRRTNNKPITELVTDELRAEIINMRTNGRGVGEIQATYRLSLQVVKRVLVDANLPTGKLSKGTYKPRSENVRGVYCEDCGNTIVSKPCRICAALAYKKAQKLTGVM